MKGFRAGPPPIQRTQRANTRTHGHTDVMKFHMYVDMFKESECGCLNRLKAVSEEK